MIARDILQKQCRGQLSLEALLAFTMLISALSVMIFAAQGLGQRLARSAGESSVQYSAAYSALCLDEAAQSMWGADFRVAQQGGFIVGNGSISSSAYPSAGERFFHNITYGAGRYDVQNQGQEPV